MKVWLTTIGEPVPVDAGARDRLHRTGFFAHYLAEHGHDVTWWTSTFDHFRHRHWFDQDAELTVSPSLRVKLLHGGGYRSNLSLARFRDHRRIAAKYARQIRTRQDRPDVIVAALPTIELCYETAKYGQESEVPVVLDMRDMWPDIFVDAVPGPARFAARLLLKRMFAQSRTACRQATAITGITDAFVDWGLARAGRTRASLDRAFPMGYLSVPPAAERIRAAEDLWDQRGVSARDAQHFNVLFVGAIGRQFDLDTVLTAARTMATQDKRVRFILCGRGDRLGYFKQQAAGLPNVMFPGWVDAAEIHVLLRRSAVGLDPLPDRYDFLATINNKAIEYFSAGLPVISSPTSGVLADLVARERCGLSYGQGDADKLVSILGRLSTDANAVKVMADNAARLFARQFTAEQVYGRMMAYLDEVVAAYRTRSEELTRK